MEIKQPRCHCECSGFWCPGYRDIAEVQENWLQKQHISARGSQKDVITHYTPHVSELQERTVVARLLHVTCYV